MARYRYLFFGLIFLFGLSSQAADVSYPVIVQISPTVSINTLAATLGGAVLDGIPGANTYLLKLPFLPLPAVATQLGMQWMELNTRVSVPGFASRGVLSLPRTAAADWYKLQPAMQLIKAGNALPFSTGRGVVVADINSRPDYAHRALARHLTSGYDFVASNPGTPFLLDQSDAGFLDQSDAGFLDQSDAGFLDQSDAGFLDQSDAGFLDHSHPAYLDGLNPAYSHGSMSAGLIAAIAPDSMIMPLRVFGDDGQGNLFMLAKAIRYAVDHGAQVINVNFGILKPSLAIKSAVDFALASNVLLVAPAGNANTSQPQYPAAFAGVMAAAATDLSDTKGLFSNYGGYVFASVPGVDIISAYPGGYYSLASGTSLSAAILAGTAALVRSVRSDGVRDSIGQTALNIDSRNPSYANQLGHGRINILGAVMPQNPVIAAVSPNTGKQGQTLVITVTGQSTHFLQGTTRLSVGTGVTITNVVVNSTTSLSAQVSIANDAAIGTQALTAETNTEVVTLGNAFTIVAKVAQTIVFRALSNKIYGDPPFAVSATGGGSTQSIVFTTSGTCSISGNIVTITRAGSCTVTASQQGDVNYKPAQPISQSFTINKAVASVRPNDGGKIYGSSDPVLTGTLSGFLPADNVTGIFTRVAGETVGSYTVSGAAGPASVLSNYDITYNTASLMIAPLAVSVTPNPAAKTFGDTDPNPLTTGTLNGFLARDNVTASYSRTAGEAPGQYTINATLAPAAVLSNYTITYNTAGFTIRKYMFSVCDGNGHCTGGSKPNDNGIGSRITITSPAEYGGNATATVTVSPATVNGKNALISPGVGATNQPLPPVMTVWLAAAGDPTHPALFGTGTATRVGPDANGNQAWQTSITAPLNVPSPGDYTVYVYGDDGSSRTNSQVQSNAGYSRTDTTDFIYPTLTAPLTVTRWLTTTSINAPAVSYNTAGNVTVTVTSASGTPTGNVSLRVDGGAPASVALSNGSATFTINGLNAGQHSLTASYAGQGDFDFAASSSTGMLHVHPLPITVAADAKAKTYGDPDPALTYQIMSGALVNGGSFTGSLTRVAGNNIGTYVLQPGTLSAGSNYSMTFIAALLTINRKSASVRPNAGGKIYGSSDPVLTGTLSGFLPADNVTGIFTRVAGETVGSYTVSGAAGPASVLSNYDITYNTASLMIAPLAVSVTPNPASKTFGDTDPNPLTAGTLNGFLARDNVTASYSRTAGEAPGQYTINATLAPAAVLSNYTITYNTASFTIRK